MQDKLQNTVMLKHVEDENENPNDGDVSDGGRDSSDDGVLDPNSFI